MTYRNIRKAESRTRLDRDTWARPALVDLSYDTIGAGAVETELIDFGIVFENPPLFAFGVELAPGQTLIAGDFPDVNCGVRNWEVTEVEADSQATPFYLGAYLWINVISNSTYRLRFRLSFEGIAMRNVEYFRGLNG